MSDGSWKLVLEDYQYAQTQNWGEDYVWMEKLVSHLLENRDLSMLYPITSHFRLTAFIGNDFSEKYKKPSISINLTHLVRTVIRSDEYRYLFSLTTRYEDGEFYREIVESVCGSFEKSLEVFDEMFEKLKGATETRLTVYQKNENNHQ